MTLNSGLSTGLTKHQPCAQTRRQGGAASVTYAQKPVNPGPPGRLAGNGW